MGNPPNEFKWIYNNDDDKNVCIGRLSPKIFKNMLIPSLNLNDFVLLCNVPSKFRSKNIKTDLKFKYMPIDIDDNNWFQLMKQWRKDKSKEVNMEYEPISLDYFLNMEFAGGSGGKEIITQNQTLKTVRDVYMFYSVPGNVQTVKDRLIPNNWQYFNCILAEFRKGVGDHHKLGWDNMTEEYYYNLELMNDNELETFLRENPVEFDNGFINVL